LTYDSNAENYSFLNPFLKTFVMMRLESESRKTKQAPTRSTAGAEYSLSFEITPVEDYSYDAISERLLKMIEQKDSRAGFRKRKR